jgi:Uma2 family endonuclease
MNWQEVCEEPTLQNLPFKIELNRHGQVVMSPASNRQGRNQTRIAAKLLALLAEGEVITECSVDTSEGTKVADAAWLSADFVARHGLSTPYPEAPEICVEVVSPSNSSVEMEEKRGLYFTQGAKEVWICDEEGQVKFFNAEGALDASALVPDFPDCV